MSAGNERNKVRRKARTSTPDKLYGGDAAREERVEIAAARDEMGMGKYDNAPYTRGGHEGAGEEVDLQWGGLEE